MEYFDNIEFLFAFDSTRTTPSDVFIGFHRDTCAAVALQVCHQLGQTEGDETWEDEVNASTKQIFLATLTIRLGNVLTMKWLR